MSSTTPASSSPPRRQSPARSTTPARRSTSSPGPSKARRPLSTGRLAAARSLGRSLGARVAEPELFERRLEPGLRRLADPATGLALARRTAGPSDAIGVPRPLLRAVAAGLRRPLARTSPAIAIYLADRLSRAAVLEARLLAVPVLEASLTPDPERTWQLIRRLGRGAAEPLTIEALASLMASGIRAEPYRWAELEQLAYAASPWERRLVGATLARLASPAAGARGGLTDSASDPEAGGAARRSLDLCASLLGDARPEVQTALARAIRAWCRAVPEVGGSFVEAAARAAEESADGQRAWVLRRAATGLEPGRAHAVRARLAGLRRSPSGRDTSLAHAAVAAFAAGGFRLPDAPDNAEPPLAPAAAGRPAPRSLAR